jgi:hypothetical protein
MVGRLVLGGLSALKWALCAFGPVAAVVLAMLAMPLQCPPKLRSISETVRSVDRSTMPGLQRFSASDGTELTYRHYPARGPASGRTAILVHGSSGSRVAVHALADALAARGYEAAIRAAAPSADVKPIEGVNHLAIVSAPKAISAIAEDVADRGVAGS